MNNSDLIYFDATTKSLVSTTTAPQQLTFKDIRNSDIIAKPEDYKMSIVRFVCDTSLLPVFIPTIQPNQSSPDLTVYTVRLDYDGAFVEVPITWVPEVKNVPIPPGPSTLPYGLQQDTAYYYSLNYQHFIGLINVALKSAMDQLKVLKPAIASVLTPFLGWDPTTLCAELIVSVGFETFSIRLFFNKALYALFSSFASNTFPNTSSLGEIYQIKIESNNSYNLIPDYRSSSVARISLKQNYSTISSWSPVSSIVFTSNSIPVVSTYVSSPQITFEGQSLPTNAAGNNTVNIITDISTLENSYKPTLLYNPTAQYRYFSLYGSSPLKNIEISVFWRSTQGKYYPLLVSSGGSASMKLLFEKK